VTKRKWRERKMNDWQPYGENVVVRARTPRRPLTSWVNNYENCSLVQVTNNHERAGAMPYHSLSPRPGDQLARCLSCLVHPAYPGSPHRWSQLGIAVSVDAHIYQGWERQEENVKQSSTVHFRKGHSISSCVAGGTYSHTLADRISVKLPYGW
jgi:hypothetical protein